MKSRNALFIFTAIGFFAFPLEASARSFRVNDLPNGNKFQCLDCHTSNSGHNNTTFGNDALHDLSGSGSTSSRHVNWAALCPVDSDGDGFTNGEELGDPNCTWVRGMANPPGPVSNPGLASSVPATTSACGNGSIEAGEDCDGSNLGGASCSSLGLGQGSLGCSSACNFDTSGCSQGSSDAGAGSGAGGGDSGFGGGAPAQPSSKDPPPIYPIGCSVSIGPDGSSLGSLAAAGVALVLAARVRRRRA